MSANAERLRRFKLPRAQARSIYQLELHDVAAEEFCARCGLIPRTNVEARIRK